MSKAMSREEFQHKLLEKGQYYHIHHPFHQAMYSGKCTKTQIRMWVANRFYYQTSIPVKDAAILANCEILIFAESGCNVSSTMTDTSHWTASGAVLRRG